MPAAAQDTAAQDQAAAETTDANTIVVTGSLIRNPNLVQATPVNVTTADQIELKQSNTAEDVLREVPGVVSNIGSAVNNGNGGSSYVDLRGLGSNRNIVLIDGQRIVPADLQGRVDLNNIPLALISRVDALTGAAVTTYGADAITGVVNFITKKDFSGVDLSVSDQITEKGDGNYFRADVTTGVNFDDGRGNAVLSLGYQNSNPVYQGARDFSYYQLDSYSGSAGGSGTAVPSRFSINGGNKVINPTTGLLESGFTPFNFNPYNIFQTPFRRFNIFAQANYQLSDAVEVYTRGMFSKNTVSTIIAPSGVFASSVVIPYSNPYLPAGAAGQFCSANGLSIAECDAARVATDPTDPNYRTFSTVLRRRMTETGTRNSEYASNVFDYSLGFRGKLTSTVDWDLRGSYGESDKTQTITGYVLTSRVRDALLATNTSTCLSGNAGCVPLNVFGAGGSITPAQAAYLLSPSTTSNKTSLLQVRGLLSGDFGWSVPSASEPVGFALGSEYRKYGAKQISDTLSKTPGELGGAGGAAPDIDGAYDVWEGYGELIVPLVNDKPFFKSLTAEGGARYSKYSVRGGGSNEAWTYKFGGSWEPVADLKIRGNYAHAVRAPNIAELFTPLTTGLTNLASDPCAGAAPVTNANLRAVCLAQGAPASSIGQILDPTGSQANVTSGGNLNLKPEKANTWTVGAVVQPSAVPGFSFSVDYYNIKVTDVIGSPLPGDLISACFDGLSASSATNTACTVIRRDPATGGLDGDPAVVGGLFSPLGNLGTLFTSGVDVVLNYSHDFGAVKWALNATGNYTAHSKYQATPTSINRECVGYYSANCSFTGSIQPKYQWSVRNTFGIGQADISFLWRHISGVKQEPADVVASGPAFEGTVPAGNGVLSGQNVNFGKIDGYDIFDLTTRFNVDQITFTVTVQNLFNKKPPIVGNTIGSTTYNSGNTYPSTYDALGRRFAVGARVKF
ncbi:TonB-dependent receptor [Novosphingobium sp. KCTC 2891]|uniref:TonB-dependent receptor domain-containing protein n=1 Tax=Novosphingobium sp. KCTC 2891 TaxID=2989730 RepID=UPI002221DA37|nr:TonB-dependent receptor [Novosphingobium sp. KCTC 2891]MCW1382217.1 TonB-dependent receptor [Novosphingobium sp. KCTC 2891]